MLVTYWKRWSETAVPSNLIYRSEVMKPYGIIYKATNLINGKCYIGQTTRGFEKRVREHNNLSGNTKGYYFHNAVRKYGKDNFEWEILCECESKTMLDIMETFKIMVNHSHISEGGYNLTWGGEGSIGLKLSEETKERMRYERRNRVYTNEYRENQSKTHIGRIPWNKGKTNIFSKDALKRISEGSKNRPVSDEIKLIRSNLMMGNKLGQKYPMELYNKVVQLRKSGVVLKKISNETGISYTRVQKICKENNV
jgi:group I intron endonuclease